MSFRRYIASTAREAMDRVRRELGEDAVILSNKRLGPGRVEIVAAASNSMQALVEEADRPRAAARQPAVRREREQPDTRAQTDSFQDFIRRQSAPAPVRQREEPALSAKSLSRAEPGSARAGVAMYHEVARAHVEPEAPAADSAPRRPALALEPMPAPAVFRRRSGDEPVPGADPQARPAVQARPKPPARPTVPTPADPTEQDPSSMMIAGSASSGLLTTAATRPSALPTPPEMAATPPPALPLKPMPAAATPTEEPVRTTPARDDTQVMAELRSLRAALSDRIAALESNIASVRDSGAGGAGGARTSAETRVMTRLLMSGFSPDLARRIAPHAPAASDAAATDAWLHEVVATNLRCASAQDGLMESNGAVALVGPTGVGKTTTVAKLAARFAVRYGAAQLGLITLDSYRIAAQEQLRSYSRILGVPMHIAQDGATLRELLASLQGKRLVLIDTCGLSQRDERMEEMLGILGAARFGGQPVRRVLLLNAASHSETLDEVARAWHAQDAAGAILTKLDEAARIGGALDCLLRYRMTLFGLTNGQRVPEDWHPAGARLIAHVALKPSTSPFMLGDEEAQAWSEQPQGSVHA
jgi:flagellar biosynthesis protein FlhF